MCRAISTTTARAVGVALALLVVATPATAADIVLESQGWRIHGLLMPGDEVQAERDPAASVLLLHGAAGDRNDFAPLAAALNKDGFDTLALELRGHGESTNLGRFERPYAENAHLNDEAWRDIVVAMNWLRVRHPEQSIAVVAASYSGEQAALALRKGDALADAYVMFSPGDFQDGSIAAIGPSGVPWLFIRTEQESPNSLQWIDEIYALLPKQAPDAEIFVYPGEGHATRMLTGRDDLLRDVANWLSGALQQSVSR